MLKRSLTIAGHRTSIALEPEFWAALEALAARRGLRLTVLIEAIDSDRDTPNLTSALRLAVLFHHARRAIDLPRITLEVGRAIRFGLGKRWLAAHPLTSHLIEVERAEWADLGLPWRAETRRNPGRARPCDKARCFCRRA